MREAVSLWLDASGTPAEDGGAAEEAELRREAAADGLPVRSREVGMALAA